MSYINIVEHYEECLRKHGDSHLGVDWPNEEDAKTRYKVMLNVIKNKDKECTILDFGCGCGHLFDFITDPKIKYSGLDLSVEYINMFKNKYPDTDVYCIDILKEDIKDIPNFDYIILNGVFTERCGLSEDDMFNFIKKILIKLFNKTNIGIAFNIMTPLADWYDEKLFYLSFDKLTYFLKNKISKNLIINHNYNLWEYTVYVYK